MSFIRNFLLLGIIFNSMITFAGDITVTQYGAVGDGITLNTKAIQNAIDECSKQGGGKVLFPAGNWLSGTILLKDNVTINLHEKAVLSGSTDINHYQLVDAFRDGRGSSMGYCFIGAKDAKNIGISGKGKIAGNGKLLLEKNGRGKRPFLVRFVRCTNVTVSDVHMEGPAAWTAHFFECRNVLAERVIIRSRGLSNNDGFDIDCCDQVVIRDCDIDSGDDAICLKTTGPKPCKNIKISGCKINTNQAAFKLGTESAGDFENIDIKNCTIKECKGIKLYSVDGSHLKKLNISDITIEKTTLPVLLRLGARLKTFREAELKKPVGTIEGVNISNITVDTATQMAFLVSGIPGHLIKDVRISNIAVNLPGGGNTEDAKVKLQENEADYPEVTMFGKIMPSFGMYIRHAKNIKIENISISLKKPDARPAIIGIDLEDVYLKSWKIPVTVSPEPLVSLDQVRNITLAAIMPSEKPRIFLNVIDQASYGIVLDALNPGLTFGPGVNPNVITVKKDINNSKSQL